MLTTRLRLLSTSSLCYAQQHSRYFAAQAGTVKFYLRDKGYGFIQPDNAPDSDVFVHRNVLLSSHVIPVEVLEASVRYPYLKKDERVMFEMEYDESGMRRAKNVTWLNGTKINPERRNYLGGVHERAKRMLGERVYQLLQAHGEEEDDTTVVWAQIQKEFKSAHMAISNGEEVVRRLGMDIKDFPTIKSNTGRGKYLYEGEAVEEKFKKQSSTTEKEEEEDISFASMANEPMHSEGPTRVF